MQGQIFDVVGLWHAADVIAADCCAQGNGWRSHVRTLPESVLSSVALGQSQG